IDNTLVVTGGGTMTMGANIPSDILDVTLSPGFTPYNFTANAISGLRVHDGFSITADTIQAGGTNQTLTGGGPGTLTMVGAAAGGDTFLDTAALFNGDTVKGFGANGDEIDLSNLGPSSAHISFTENSANTAGTLKVSDNQGHSAAIILF